MKKLFLIGICELLLLFLYYYIIEIFPMDDRVGCGTGVKETVTFRPQNAGDIIGNSPAIFHRWKLR